MSLLRTGAHNQELRAMAVSLSDLQRAVILTDEQLPIIIQELRAIRSLLEALAARLRAQDEQ